MKKSATWICLLLGIVSATSVGCGAEQSPPIPSPAQAPQATPGEAKLPPRPAVLSLANLDPCALLTAGQVDQLGTAAGRHVPSDDRPDGYHCKWTNFPAEPENNWWTRVEDRGAEQFVNTQTQVVQVNGFPAVQTYSGLGGPEDNCILLLDLAPGQSLRVSYIASAESHPGINHQIACQQAARAAEMMVSNLRPPTGGR